jgi:lysozyme family protein
MADINVLVPIILQWEGGYTNNPDDSGHETNMGITIATWKQVGYDKDGNHLIDSEDIKLLNKDDFRKVLRLYWDRWRGDEIANQSIADILVDWVWGSGRWGVILPQKLLGLKADGIVGSKTITVVNSANQKQLFDDIFARRMKFLEAVVANNPSQSVFLQGWKNRLNSFTFTP